MKAFAYPAICALALTACAGVTDVVSTGPSTYMVAAEGTLGASSSSKQAVKAQEQAAAFCNKQGKQVETISVKEVPAGYGQPASATVNFRCIDR
ncbi:MAG: hypothetical protein U1F09_02110 [Steroidobacteraceae bacterium]